MSVIQRPGHLPGSSSAKCKDGESGAADLPDDNTRYDMVMG